MIRGSFQTSSTTAKVLISLFAIVLGLAASMALSLLLAVIFFDIDLHTLSKSIDPLNPENIPLLKFFQAFYSIGLFVLPPVLIAFVVQGKIVDYLRINKLPGLYMLVLSLLVVLFAIPSINVLVQLNKGIVFPDQFEEIERLFRKMEDNSNSTIQSFLQTNSISGYLVNILVIALIPAIGEELLFRGVFQRMFYEWSRNIHLAIILSAFIFSAMHMQFYGLLPRMVLGALFGYLFYWSQNLWLAVIAHFFNNALAVTFYYLEGGLAQKAESVGTGGNSLYTVGFSIIAVGIIMYLIYKNREK
jgi:uncharacterized protein